MPKCILSISYDQSLLKTQHWILQKQGYDVVSVLGFVEAAEACAKVGYDLLILGQTLPKEDKAALAKLAKNFCGTRVLSLRGYGQQPIAEADYSTDQTDPRGLIEAVDRALTAT